MHKTLALFLVALLSRGTLIAHNEFYGVSQLTIVPITVPPSCTADIIRWPSNIAAGIPVRISLDGWDLPSSLDGTLTVADFKSAFETWHNASSSFYYSEVDENSSVQIEFSIDATDFRDPESDAGITYLAAYTEYGDQGSTTYWTSDGEVMYFNNTDRKSWTWTNATVFPSGTTWLNFQQVAVHEIGHLLGLNECTISSAVMYGTTITNDENHPARLALSSDDLAGLALLATVTSVCELNCGIPSPTNFQAQIVGQDVRLTWVPAPNARRVGTGGD